MWRVYVLRSLKDGRHYVGITSRPLDERLQRHNAGRVRSTKGRRPLVLAHSENHPESAASSGGNASVGGSVDVVKEMP